MKTATQSQYLTDLLILFLYMQCCLSFCILIKSAAGRAAGACFDNQPANSNRNTFLTL
jgi:hypothetical protein